MEALGCHLERFERGWRLRSRRFKYVFTGERHSRPSCRLLGDLAAPLALVHHVSESLFGAQLHYLSMVDGRRAELGLLRVDPCGLGDLACLVQSLAWDLKGRQGYGSIVSRGNNALPVSAGRGDLAVGLALTRCFGTSPEPGLVSPDRRSPPCCAGPSSTPIRASIRRTAAGPSWFARTVAQARPAWHADGACHEHPDLSWFAATDQAEAVAVCRRCLVRDECVSLALEHHEQGVWGGTTDRERVAIRRARQRGQEAA